MMFRLLILLLFIPLACAASIAPKIYEQKDFGPTAFEEFTYSVSVDCTAGAVKLFVMDESLEPVRDSDTYLKYIDFAQPLISSVKTDKDGYAVHKLPGNVKLMRGLFVLVIQKSDYRSKEVHFDVARCWTNETLPQPPSTPQKNGSPPAPQKNGSPPKDVTPPINITTPGNQSSNITNGSSVPGEEGVPELCPGIPALLMLFKFFRG